MDDKNLGYLSSLVLFVIFGLSLAGHSTDFEYVRPELRQQLEREFYSNLLAPIDSLSVKNKVWSCDMYGMRTHLQVKRGVKLYQWRDSTNWHNGGDQAVSEYELREQTLVGKSERFEDEVKLNRKGQLLSQLRMRTPERTVLAYSVCNLTEARANP